MFQDFITLWLSLIIEALPFIVLGVFISGLVATFISSRWVLEFMPKNSFFSHLIITFLGVLLPVCECGNIPIARRILMLGLQPSHAITFMLAAPIINPVTVWTTLEAFPGQPQIALARVILAFIAAYGIGLLFSFYKNQNEFLTPEFTELCAKPEHDHHHKRWENFISQFNSELKEVLPMLIFGAAIAAASRSLIPNELIASIGQNPFMSVVAMMVIAFVISICANVDAFFAASLVNKFTTGGLVTFLVFGPMIDIKILNLLRTTFTIPTLIKISLLVAGFTLSGGLLINLIS